MPRHIYRASILIRPDRQRRTFDLKAMQELEESIQQFGLMHPVVVRENADGGLELVAGERRMRAIASIQALGGTIHCDGAAVPTDQVPIVTLGELSEVEAEDAQLHENLRRANLTWQEHAAAVSRLEALRRKIALESGKDLPTPASLAEEVGEPKREGFAEGASGYAKDQIRKELVVAKYLDRPTVRAAKSVDEAFKIVKREEELARSEALGVSVGRTFTRASHTLLQGDCLTLLAGLEPGFDVILTDPPYGMGADDFGTSAGRNMPGEAIHSYRDDDAIITDVVLPALEQSSLLCRPAAHAYIFCDIDRFHQLRAFFEALGWKPFRTPLVWVKPDGRVPLPSHGPRRTYEVLLYAFRGDKPTRKVGSDTLPYPPDTNLNLAAQKPVALFTELLSRSCLPGDRVLDPFCGTGTIIPAAHSLRVAATGIERNPQVYGIAAKRLEDLQ